MTTGQATDKELLDRTHAGDLAAFQLLYQRHLDTVFRFAYRMLGSQEQAEDVAHDCFLSLIRNPRRFDPLKGSLRTYLFVTVRNLVHKRLRRLPPTFPIDAEVAQLPSDRDIEPLPRLLAQELSREVRKAVVRMPARQREVVVLSEYEQLSLDEIAVVVGTNIGTVKSRLHRARTWLRRELAAFMKNASLRPRKQASNE